MVSAREPVECIESGMDGSGCQGPVAVREALSGTGRRFPRCEGHWQRRLARQQQIEDRYPRHPPADWSPLDAGEAWGEDDY